MVGLARVVGVDLVFVSLLWRVAAEAGASREVLATVVVMIVVAGLVVVLGVRDSTEGNRLTVVLVLPDVAEKEDGADWRDDGRGLAVATAEAEFSAWSGPCGLTRLDGCGFNGPCLGWAGLLESSVAIVLEAVGLRARMFWLYLGAVRQRSAKLESRREVTTDCKSHRLCRFWRWRRRSTYLQCPREHGEDPWQRLQCDYSSVG